MRSTFLVLLLIPAISLAGTYDGPTDESAYREPKDVACSGVPNFAKGASLTFPKGASVGNLEDGFSLPMAHGKIGILYFEFMTLVGESKLEGAVSYIDVLDDMKVQKADVSCDVKSWYD